MAAVSPDSKSVWLRIFWIVLGAFLIYRGFHRWADGVQTWRTWLYLGLGAWLIVYEGYGWWKQRATSVPGAENEEDRPLSSLVYLLENPRDIKAGRWIAEIGAAFGVELNGDEGDSTDFIMPMPHPSIPPERGSTYMLQNPAGVFWIFHVHQPYFEDPREVLESIKDRRLRDAVERHKAWLSVDLMHWRGDEGDRNGIYAAIGRIMAVLAGPDVTAVFAPELGRCNEFEASLIDKLKSENPLEIFDQPTFEPVLSVEDDDEEMEKAKAEAKRRWPEFVEHFRVRDPRSNRPFAVKARFVDESEAEFMWVVVDRVEPGRISGTLGNQPHRLTNFHAGQRVDLDEEEVMDWLCADGDERPLGGWTDAVLQGRPGKHLGT